MRKKRFIAGLLSILLLIGFVQLPSLFANEKLLVAYVSANGEDTNHGDTTENPVQSLSKAFEITSNGATIVIMDIVSYDLTKSYGGVRTIMGNDSNAVLSFGEGNLKLYQNLIMKNIVLENQSIDCAIYTDTYSFMIGEGVHYQGITETDNPLIITGSEEEYRKFTIEKADFESGNLVIQMDSYVTVTNLGKTPVAVSDDGRDVFVADDLSIDNANVYLTESAATDYKEYISYRKGLPNVFKKLENGEKIDVVYFGGSVTVGTGAGDTFGASLTNKERDTHSWRALIGQWLNEHYPDQINNINEGLGESGTYMGSYRIRRILEEHVQAGETPDLFFIEYSINDYYTRRSSETTTTRYDRSASQFETIVREIKEVNPECDIVTVLVADNSTMQQAKQGILHTEAQAHEDISIAYNMPSLKFGSAIANKVENLYYDNGIASDAWKENFADIVHPTSKGYAEYYKCIAEFMNNSLLCAEYVETELPELAVAVQSKTLFDGNRTVMDMTADLFAQSTGSGFVLNPNDSKYEFKGSISAANAGSTFTYSFNGTETSILTNKTSASKFTVKIDGENYTPSAGSLSHNPITLAKGLTEGHHTVEITTVDADTTIYAIFTHDTSATTKQGAAVETEHKKAALTLPSGSYTIKYYEKATVSEIPKPVAEGLTFTHWCDESGKIMHDEDALQAGMKLKARFWVQGMNINPDVNDDGYMNEKDTQLLREILVGASNIMYFDVNCDNQCDVKDLVALKKFLTDIWQRDNNYSVNDL